MRVSLMAETGISNKDLIGDLKSELQRLVESIIEESPSEDETGFALNVDRAIQTLQTLKDVKKRENQRSSSILEPHNRIVGFYPQEFNCPLTKNIMRDPVIVSTGVTYDRCSIQKWLKEGNRACPITQQLLPSPNLIPNHLVQIMISKWCKNRGIRYPSPDHPPLLLALLKTITSATSDAQKEAAWALRSLTKRLPSFRAHFSEYTEFIPQLLSPLTQSEIDPNLHQYLITTLMNLSIHETNKKTVAETPLVIPILLNALRSGTIKTKRNAAATLCTLSALDTNKSLIGKAGALKPLIDLLEEGQSLAMKDVASAIFSLCINDENKGRAVENGAVRVVLKKIEERVHVDELLVILAMLSDHQKAVVEMAELGAVSSLFLLIKETKCEQNKENCIAVVHRICLKDENTWKEMREEEGRYGTISKIVENGSSRAKRKAKGVLDRINMRRAHTA
ncbi:U-box domain-containing protein 9-like [Cynara cardunculus var. scolymus]|nr:U-box domain-containing protein 9-like [Cynara cardunculus var. scolymus]